MYLDTDWLEYSLLTTSEKQKPQRLVVVVILKIRATHSLKSIRPGLVTVNNERNESIVTVNNEKNESIRPKGLLLSTRREMR